MRGADIVPSPAHKVHGSESEESQVERKPLSLKVCAVRHEKTSQKIPEFLENECSDDDTDDPDERASVRQVESIAAFDFDVFVADEEPEVLLAEVPLVAVALATCGDKEQCQR
jgi:hypothetical protein